MSNLTYIEDLRKEIENLCGDCDRPNKEKLGEIILSSMALGFNAGMKATSADRPQGEWIDAEIPLESGGSMPIQACNLCKTFYPLAYTGGGHRFCPNCGARMFAKDINVPNKKGADDEV